MTTERFSLKDHLFNEEKVEYLADLLGSSVPNFARDGFVTAVMEQMPALELKQRVALIAEILADHLDPDFPTAAEEIRQALPPPLDPTRSDDDFGDFILAPFGRYVEDHGIDHYGTSMDLLKELTMRFSMEGSVRPFINNRPEDSLALFGDWARDDNYHVRRLVSESTRPTLPWAPRIDLDIRAPLPLLDVLHSDPTRYVTRSVANHLNDISKIEPELAIDALERWRMADEQDPAELSWMENHALRTLVKAGDARAMTFLGFSPEPAVQAALTMHTPRVKMGDVMSFSLEIAASNDEPLIVDYVIDFMKKNGSTSPKVFKLKRLSMRAGETATLGKRHVLPTNATTYTLYPGTHRLTVVVNGQAMARTEFELRMA